MKPVSIKNRKQDADKVAERYKKMGYKVEVKRDTKYIWGSGQRYVYKVFVKKED